MEHMYFGCEKEYIEQVRRIAQKHMLIDLYCSKNFAFFNLVDFYYRSISENAILMFIIICAIYPVLFMCVAFIADNYLAIGMQDLSKRFNLTPSMAAVTLIAFANGAPDVLSSLAACGKEGGALISLGSLYGGFISSLTLVVSNVVWNAGGEVKLPKFTILKELGFYFISVLVIIAFGFRQSTGYLFIGCYLSLYAVYIMMSIIMERFGPSDIDENVIDIEEHGRVEDIPNDFQTLNSEKRKTIEYTIDDQSDDVLKQETLFGSIIKSSVDVEGSLMENLVLIPLSICGMLTVTYLNNPFMKTGFKYMIIVLSVLWTVATMELSEAHSHGSLIVGMVVSIVFMVLEYMRVNPNALAISYEFMSVFAAIGWLKLISGLIIDFITFLAFYFNINEVILSSILLSAGNTVSDYFGNGALAKAGCGVMAGLASYSGQIFNNFIAFTASIIGSLSITTDFDIFGIGDKESSTSGEDEIMAIESKFIIIVILCVLLLLIIQLIYFFMNDFILKKSFTYVLVAIYAAFFTGSLAFGILSTPV